MTKKGLGYRPACEKGDLACERRVQNGAQNGPRSDQTIYQKLVFFFVTMASGSDFSAIVLPAWYPNRTKLAPKSRRKKQDHVEKAQFAADIRIPTSKT